MSASKVYFTDMRCPVGTGLLDKLKKLIEKAGIDSIDMDSKFVAIKIHFGEPGNLSFLRPNFAKVVADKVTSLGGRPFLTDCNTLYVGRRKHALEHLAAAQENGFSPLSTGCQMIIADGLKGTDEMEVPLEGCDHFQSAFIGRAIMDADIFISLTHFKGHELTGFGGAIKNIGMGCGSRAGKMAMHSIGKPGIDAEKCRGCKTCTHYCAQSAISIGEDHKARIDHDLCAGCGRCIGVCNFDAISNAFDAESTILNERMAEYTKAVIQNRPHFHVSIVNQVSPYCAATPRTTPPWCPTSACSPASTPWPWTTPVSTRSTPRPPSAPACWASALTSTTTTSPTSIPRPTGAARSSMPGRSASATWITSW